MRVLNINDTLIRVDRITGFSELDCFNSKTSSTGWCWGFKVYADTQIIIKLKHNTNSDKSRANIERIVAINAWKEYLRKDSNEIRY